MIDITKEIMEDQDQNITDLLTAEKTKKRSKKVLQEIFG